MFATLQTKPGTWIQVALGLGSVAAGVLATLQMFYNYSERAEKHRIAAANYGALGRELELIRADPREPNITTLSELKERLDELALEAPATSERIYVAAVKRNLP